MRTLALVVFTILLAACAGDPVAPATAIPATAAQPGAGTGTLHIYRPGSGANALRTVMVYIDGQAADRLSNDGRVTMNLDAGSHTVQIGRHTTMVTIEAGQDTFLRYRYGWALFNLIPLDPGELKQVEAVLAKSELDNGG